MPKEQLVKKEADIIPIDQEREALREEYFQYSLGPGKEKRERLGELNREISGLEEELDILKDVLSLSDKAKSGRKNKKVILTNEQVSSIEEAIQDLNSKLFGLRTYTRHFLESSITPDTDELNRVRRELAEEKERERKHD